MKREREKKRSKERQREKKANIRQRNENAMKGVWCWFVCLLGDYYVRNVTESNKKKQSREGRTKKINRKNTQTITDIYFFVCI